MVGEGNRSRHHGRCSSAVRMVRPHQVNLVASSSSRSKLVHSVYYTPVEQAASHGHQILKTEIWLLFDKRRVFGQKVDDGKRKSTLTN